MGVNRAYRGSLCKSSIPPKLPPILPHGNALSELSAVPPVPRLPQQLGNEIATVGRNFIVPTYGGNRLHPQDETLISRGGGGWAAYDIYSDLAKDNHVFAVLQKRYMAVIGREWEVKPASESAIDVKAAELVKAHLQALSTRSETEEDGEALVTTGGGFDHTCWGLLSAILYGYQPAEIIWSQDGKEVYPEEIRIKDLRRFSFAEGKKGFKLRLLTWDNSYDGMPLPPKKFIVHRFASLPIEDPYGLGLGTRLFYPTFFKRNTVKFWLVFADKFATPTAIGKHPRNASRQQKDALLDALRSIATDSGITIPEDMAVEFLEAARGSTVSTYEGLVEFCNREISKCVLGETGTTDQQGSGGSRARDQVGNEVRIEVAKADADLLSETLNKTIVRWIVQLNLPDANPPTVWRRFPELEEKFDRSGEATIVSTLVNAGYKPTQKWVAEKFEIELEEPEPEQPEIDPDQAPDLARMLNAESSAEEPTEEEQPAEETAEQPPELSETVEFGSIVDRIIQWNGLSIGVEYLPGQVRFPGRKHSKKLRSGYGHIRNYKGADGEALDCYLFSGFFKDVDDDEPSDLVFEITQLTQDGEFDEHKFLLGFGELEEAKSAYLREMPEFLFGGIREVSIAELEQYRKPTPEFTEAEEDSIDRLTQSAIDQSQPVFTNWIDGVRSLINSAESLEEVRDQIFDLYSGRENFAEVMGQALAIAELAGRYEVIQEGQEGTEFEEALELLQSIDSLSEGTVGSPNFNEALSLLLKLDAAPESFAEWFDGD